MARIALKRYVRACVGVLSSPTHPASACLAPK